MFFKLKMEAGLFLTPPPSGLPMTHSLCGRCLSLAFVWPVPFIALLASEGQDVLGALGFPGDLVCISGAALEPQLAYNITNAQVKAWDRPLSSDRNGAGSRMFWRYTQTQGLQQRDVGNS